MADAIADSEETQRLLEQVRAGDRPAFERLFERHRTQLRRTIEMRTDARLRARVDPSDVVQETHLEAFRDGYPDYLHPRCRCRFICGCGRWPTSACSISAATM